MILDAVVAIGSLIVPPAFDFIKKKFLKPGSDSPESTMATLAVSKPESLAPYVEAMASYQDAQTRWFNRDVSGTLWPPVANLRAAIRPCGIIVAMLHLVFSSSGIIAPVGDGLRLFYITIISSWFGAKLTKE